MFLIITSGLLSFLGLESLELRRLKADIWMTYKMFNLVNLNIDNFFAVRTNKITRGHPNTLVKPLCKVGTRGNFFACRLVDTWKNWDAISDSLKSLNAFKMFSVNVIYPSSLSISKSRLGVFIFFQCFFLIRNIWI